LRNEAASFILPTFFSLEMLINNEKTNTKKLKGLEVARKATGDLLAKNL